tara:strand:+ start:872 stop:1375 length:504 start_codon:yes stop_codon:yes gene_type:complete
MHKKKLELKKITKKDLESIIKWRNNPNIMRYNTQFFLLNMEYQSKWFEKINKKNSNQKMFIFKYGKSNVGVGGLINIDKQNKSADIAIIIGETKIHGHGIGTKILQMLVEYGFKKMKLHRIGADVFEYNHISLRLFEKLNFEREGFLEDCLWRYGRWWGIYKYSIIN